MIDEPGLAALTAVELTTSVTGYESRLLARLQAGELAAFEQLVNEYHGVVYGLALRLVSDVEEARDITQETFLKVFRYMNGFRAESGLKTWIFRIAVNQASNSQRWWRRRKRDRTFSLEQTVGGAEDGLKISDTLFDAQRNPEQQAMAHQLDERLQAALSRLKTEYRIAVVLRDIEGMTYEEIAETLAVSLGTVKSRIARGREELRQALRGLI